MLKICIEAKKFPKIPMCMFCCHSFFTHILLFYVCYIQCAECFQSCSDKIVCKKLCYRRVKNFNHVATFPVCQRFIFLTY